jgi:hypothetical protein
MFRRKRQYRELAGWQCAAGRAILRLEASAFAPLAGTTKNTILRFEAGQFMPRVPTVLEIDRALRERGVYPTFTREGDPRGVVIGWQAYGAAYPGYEVHHRTLEEIAEHQRKFPPPLDSVRSWNGVEPVVDVASPRVPAAHGDQIDALEAEQRRLIAELARLRQEAGREDDDHEFDF